MPAPTTLRSLNLAAFIGLSSLLNADSIDGVPVTVLSRTPVAEGGRVITYTRILAPVIPPKPAPSANSSPTLTTTELAENARLEAMQYTSFDANVTVHLRPPIVSEFRWRTEPGGREWVVWANIDARLLAAVSQWESATTVYSNGFSMMQWEVAGEDDIRPATLGLVPGPAEYVVEATAAEIATNETQFTALDTLLAYHDLHRAELAVELHRREAEGAEAERIAALPKPRPKNETIYFWKIETPAASLAPAAATPSNPAP